MLAALIKLYVPLISWIGLGALAGRWLPERVPRQLGLFLFWLGAPISIVVFLRQAAITPSVWVAAVVAWVAVLVGGWLAWGWVRWQQAKKRSPKAIKDSSPGTASASLAWRNPARGSFINAAALGNTGYLGYPISLMLVGTNYFGWAVFYDTLGSTLASYGLGVALAAHFGSTTSLTVLQSLQRVGQAVLRNPAMWSFWLGLGFRQVPLPPPVESVLSGLAWTVIALSLLLLGMRLSQLSLSKYVKTALVSLSIKMLIVPILVGCGLTLAGFDGPPRLVIVLQAAMPPAFATLIIAEAYHLNVDLTVTALALGSVGILLTLPLWLTLFPA
ncbi:MAG: AEC family transporter [Elainellaceae cyanobacterium]